MDNNQQNFSLEDISRLGERFYLDMLKSKLEAENFGQYVVIDVEQKKYVVSADRLAAIEQAQKDFGNKLFYIVQIGALQQPNMNYSAKKKYARVF